MIDLLKNRFILSGSYFCLTWNLIPNLVILVVLWYGGYQVVNNIGSMTAGDLASFILYSQNLNFNSQMISSGLSSIVTATGALERIF